MAKNYLYPRVSITTTALSHSSVAPEAQDTTVLFAPIVTKMGPDKEITPVHSISELIDQFGELTYEQNGQMALNIYNWLSSGGTVYVYRLGSEDSENASKTSRGTNGYFVNSDGEKIISAKEGDLIHIEDVQTGLNHSIGYDVSQPGRIKALEDAIKNPFGIIQYSDTGSAKLYSYKVLYYERGGKQYKATHLDIEADITVNAKYSGKFYNNIIVNIASNGKGKLFNVYVYLAEGKKRILLEKFVNQNFATYKKNIANSKYIDLTIELLDGQTDLVFEDQVQSEIILMNGNGPEKDLLSSESGPLYTFWLGENNEKKVIKSHLEYHIDVLMDAGYPIEVKKSMASFVNNESESSVRPDVFCYLDNYELDFANGTSKPSNPKSIEELSGQPDFSVFTASNIAIYAQYGKIYDSIFTNQQLFVAPSYFLSKLVPYNDIYYGMQMPTAGLRRGILEDCIWVNQNPDADEKDTWFRNRINYIEKSAREFAFMSQRTHDGSDESEYTALSFINNQRCLEKMKRDIELLARNYLFELNDSTTLTQMSSVLNKYINNWISNRTLSKGSVTVAKNAYSDEAVDVSIVVRFTGTIEYISVDITVE